VLSDADRGSPPTNTSVPFAPRRSAHSHTPHMKKKVTLSEHKKQHCFLDKTLAHLARRSRAAPPPPPSYPETEEAYGARAMSLEPALNRTPGRQGRSPAHPPVSSPAESNRQGGEFYGIGNEQIAARTNGTIRFSPLLFSDSEIRITITLSFYTRWAFVEYWAQLVGYRC
jgi:hypothetical protein